MHCWDISGPWCCISFGRCVHSSKAIWFRTHVMRSHGWYKSWRQIPFIWRLKWGLHGRYVSWFWMSCHISLGWSMIHFGRRGCHSWISNFRFYVTLWWRIHCRWAWRQVRFIWWQHRRRVFRRLCRKFCRCWKRIGRRSFMRQLRLWKAITTFD